MPAPEFQGRLSWVVLSHISENSNKPDLALAAVRQEVGDFPVYHAPRHGVSEVFRL